MAQVLVEEHGRIRDRPREVDVLAEPFGRSNSVLQGSLVEHVGRELREARMHAVLHLQADGAIPENNKPLKERLRQASTCRLLVHNDWTELL